MKARNIILLAIFIICLMPILASGIAGISVGKSLLGVSSILCGACAFTLMFSCGDGTDESKDK